MCVTVGLIMSLTDKINHKNHLKDRICNTENNSFELHNIISLSEFDDCFKMCIDDKS